MGKEDLMFGHGGSAGVQAVGKKDGMLWTEM